MGWGGGSFDWSSLMSMFGGGGSPAATPSSAPTQGYVPYSADVGAPNTSMAYEGGGAVPAGSPQTASTGMNLSPLFQAAGGAIQKGDKVGSALLAPTIKKREKLINLLPQGAHIGESIGPVAHDAGGIQMAKAMATERDARQSAEANQDLALLERKLRNNQALGDTVDQGVTLVRELATKYFGG